MERFTKLAKTTSGEVKVCCTSFMSLECQLHQGKCTACKVNDKAWNRLYSLEDSQRWHNAAEEKPDNLTINVVFTDTGDYAIACRNSIGWFDKENGEFYADGRNIVKYWLPLPQPPEVQK